MADVRWDKTHGTYLAGRAYLDGVDATAIDMERRWGCDRLRLLVGPELREKFDRQRYKLNAAIQGGTLEQVRQEAARMDLAWHTLDTAAAAGGARPLRPEVWEVVAADGTVIAIVQDAISASLVSSDGRGVAVYTLEEIARLLDVHNETVKAKLQWPGATVTRTKKAVSDPLLGLDGLDLDADLDDTIPAL